MTRKIECRLFSESVKFRSLEEDGETTREKKYEIEIPRREYRKLKREARKNQMEVGELVEQRFFSVFDLPSDWTVRPLDEDK